MTTDLYAGSGDGQEGLSCSLPPGAAAHDHPGWRLLFRVVDLSCGDRATSSWESYLRITFWVLLLLGALALIFWLAGPWFSVGGGGLYGVTKAGKSLYRKHIQPKENAGTADAVSAPGK
jgi:hypothetical protein